MSTSALHIFETEQLNDARRLFVIGDLHGDLFSLDTFLQHVDISENLVVLLGDYADRGEDSLGVVDRVSGLLAQYPLRVIGLKGNHEHYTADGKASFSPCHLMEEAEERKGGWDSYFRDVYTPFLSRLFLAALIPGQWLFLHGGISRDIDSIENLAAPTPDIETVVLYSDATDRFTGERYNQLRAKGIRFGTDVTQTVCQRLCVQRIVRGHQHELARTGPHFWHGARLLTVVSSNVFSRRPYVLAIDLRQPDILEKIDLRSWQTTPVSGAFVAALPARQELPARHQQ